MENGAKKNWKDVTRIGDIVATQPLSGTSIVQASRIKGYANAAFTYEASKKAS